MLLASRIAWRNEPAPLSLVFMTVKTKGATGLCASVDSRAVVAFGSLVFRTRVGRVGRVVRNALPKAEASRIDEIDNSAMARVIRSAKARGEAFFFILFFGGESLGADRAGISLSSTEEQARSFQERM